MAVSARGSRDSRAYGGERPYMRHLVQDPGIGKFLRDLSEDVDRAFRANEARTEFPDIGWVDGSAGAPNTGGGLLAVRGTDFLQGQVFESIAHGLATAMLTFTALKPGRFEHKLVVSDTGSISVAYGGTTLTIGINAGVSTADQVATAVNAAGSAAKGIIRCVSGGGGNPAALAETAFTTGYVNDGYGSGFTAKISDVEALPYHETGTTPTQSITDTLVRLTLPDLSSQSTAREASDKLNLWIESDGVRTRDFLAGINDLRNITNSPKLGWIDSSVGTAKSTGGDVLVRGENMVQGQTFDALAFGAGASQLTFHSMKPGNTGYSVELVHTGTIGVSFAASKLTVNIDTGVSTANAVATAVNAAGSAAKGIIRCVSGGAGAVVAAVEAPMVGGAGQGFLCKVSGVEALPQHDAGTAPPATITDTLLTLTLPDLTQAAPSPRSVDDQVEMEVVSDGNLVGTLSYRSKSIRPAYPKINGLDQSVSTYGAQGGALTIDCENMLQNQTFDTLIHGVGAAALTFHAMKPGASGISVEVIDLGSLSVAYAGSKLTVNIQAGVTTADQAATAVNAAGSAAKGVVRCVSGGGGTPAALAETDMAGGAGSGFTCYVGGEEALPYHATGTAPNASIADTAVSVTVPTPAGHATPRVAEDQVSIVIDTDGLRTHEFNLKERHARVDPPVVVNWNGAAVNNANNAIVLGGTGFLQGQAFDTYRVVPIAGGFMDVFSMLPGAATGLTLELVNGGGADVVTDVGGAISVDFQATVSTTDSIATAINTHATAGIKMRAWSDAANATAAGDAMAATPLAGGVGAGLTVASGGTAATITKAAAVAQQAARVTDTALTLDTGDMNADWGAAAGDGAMVVVVSDGVYSRLSVSVTLT